MKKLILFISFIVVALTSQATVWVVDSLNDSGTGSLRSKIALATSGDTIRFSPNLIANGSDSIVLATELVFNKSITFKGLYNTTDTLFLSGGGTVNVMRAMGDTLNSTVVVLDSLVIINGNKNGFFNGGGFRVINVDSVIVRNSIFKNNIGYLGGGINLFGGSKQIKLFVDNCTFSGNKVDSTGTGGAINYYSDFQSIIEIRNSRFSNNYAGQGGGLSFAQNRPGLLESNQNVKIINCIVTNNLGGGINSTTFSNFGQNYSSIIVDSCFISQNVGDAFGGGLKCNTEDSIYLEISNSSICNNFSRIEGGGVYLCSGYDSNHVSYSKLKILKSTISGNVSGKGGGISGKSVNAQPGSRPLGYLNTSIEVLNSTIANNNATTNAAIFYSSDEIGQLSELNIQSSIVTQNSSNAISFNVNNTFTSGGYNIFSDSSVPGSVTIDQLNVDSISLNLGPLGYNGGFTPTMMPIAPSVAINMGNPLDSSDAQNVPIVGIRDVGAAEVCYATYSTDSIVACDSYTWINGVTYTSDDTVSYMTFVNAAGCDSIVSLHLTVNYSNTFTDTITACNSYTWIDGVTYYQSNNTAQHTLINAVGCDSVVTLNLTISHTYIDTVVACHSYTWRNGVTYTQTGYGALDTVVVSGSCDSLFILDLTIHSREYATDTLVACDSLTWRNGVTYYSSTNSVYDTLVNRNGCDSIINLNLTINSSVHDTDHVSACVIYQWINGNYYAFSDSTAIHTFPSANGCDSLIHLDLEIKYGTIGTDTQVVCDSLIWIDGNTYYSNNTTAIHTLVGGNSNGCDSIVTLNLTVNGTTNTDMISSCGSYTWLDGVTYTSSNNTATYVTTNSLGCDSTVHLDLTILNSSTGIETVSSCESYTWNGITYYSDNNTATDTLVNSAGCDSIVTLDLTILQPTSGIDVIASCDAITWIDGNTYSSSNNTATHTLTNAVGCDSVVTLDYTRLAATQGTDVISSCTPITWIDGMVYDQSISGPTFTITNANGCDSVVTLDLTILEVDTSVTRNYLTLTAQASNATYQWIDCDNGVMAGEIGSSFTVSLNGNYQVEVTQNGCVDTSDCFSITNVGVQEATLIGILLYPNPTSDVLHIDKGSNSELEITITNSAGAVVYQSESKNQVTTVNMSQMASGTYIVTLKNQDGLKVERVVKR